MRGSTHSSQSPRNSKGTPGRHTSSALPTRIEKPGAVPRRLGMTLAPRGKRACFSLLGVMARPKLPEPLPDGLERGLVQLERHAQAAPPPPRW